MKISCLNILLDGLTAFPINLKRSAPRVSSFKTDGKASTLLFYSNQRIRNIQSILSRPKLDSVALSFFALQGYLPRPLGRKCISIHAVHLAAQDTYRDGALLRSVPAPPISFISLSNLSIHCLRQIAAARSVTCCARAGDCCGGRSWSCNRACIASQRTLS